MDLIAVIDGNGRTFIGKFGEHDDWVLTDNVEPVTEVRTEDWNQCVTPNDIRVAQKRHEIQNAGEWYYDDEVKDFFLSANESIIYNGFKYWYDYRLAQNGDICLSTTNPKVYCNGFHAYSIKDAGGGKAFVVISTNNPAEKWWENS